MNQILSWASRINAIPGLSLLSPSVSRVYSQEEQEGYLTCQNLAQNCAREIAALIQPGWSEKRAATLMEVWLRDHGVKSFFHKPFVWWGDRTKFVGVKNYWNYQPTTRVLCEGDVFILDVAPILQGYTADIGYSGCMGEHKEYVRAIAFLDDLRAEIPTMATHCAEGRELWDIIDSRITAAKFENIHATYPFGVLGHRLHRTVDGDGPSFIHFGWQSYWELMSRGLFGQILNQDFSGKMDGLWAIEPHIGGTDFGVKFEEILLIEGGNARWLNPKPHYHVERTTA